MFEQKGDSEEVKEAKRKRWGSPQGSPDGLFTGKQDEPANYAWNPNDHPEWEKSFQINDAPRSRLIQICHFKPTPVKYSIHAIEVPGQKLDFGFSGNERLLWLVHTPSRKEYRFISRILLQNAWRIENSRVNPDRMYDAITACVDLAKQMDASNVINGGKPFVPYGAIEEYDIIYWPVPQHPRW